jgi:1-acyl-sn-glycerol-3-phosphate acyltransferase
MVFVAKREVAGWPLIGAAARVQKVVFVDRVRRQQTAGAVNDMAQRLAEGHPVVLFAEGTSSDGNRVLPFRSALIGAAETAGAQGARNGAAGTIMIQPAAICYTRQYGVPLNRGRRALVAWYGDLDFTPHMAQFMREGAVDAVVQFGTPVPAGEATDRKALARTLETSVRGMMASALRGSALTPAIPVTTTPQTAGIPFPAKTG